MIVGAFAVVLLLLFAPSPSQAVDITAIDVQLPGCGSACFSVGPNQYAAVEAFWSGIFGAGFTLSAGQDLVFAQSGNTSTFFGFDFDTSEANLIATQTGGSITLTIGGTPFVFSGDPALSVGLFRDGVDIDGNSTATNETGNWVQVGATTAIGGGLQMDVLVGYADNLHTDGCPGGNTPIDNCFPNPFFSQLFAGGAAPSPIGQGASGWGGVDPTTTPCGGATDATSVVDCWDSGAIRLVVSQVPQVPEPSTLLLVGAGLLGKEQEEQPSSKNDRNKLAA
jgi:hypothetical protein